MRETVPDAVPSVSRRRPAVAAAVGRKERMKTFEVGSERVKVVELMEL